MSTLPISPALVEYLAARGVSLDAHDERPERDETFAPTAADESDYVAWRAEIDARERDLEDMYREIQFQDMLERLEYERDCNAWTVRPVSAHGITTTTSVNHQVRD